MVDFELQLCYFELLKLSPIVKNISDIRVNFLFAYCFRELPQAFNERRVVKAIVATVFGPKVVSKDD